ncbi:MAG TPA: DUF58 domain-containing protein [Campylobacterales bacterium]|nr:DUF58 domain-containing protein [Campylobacterales bacterium]
MDAIQTLLFKAKDDVYTHLQGSSFSNVLGQGYDFSELRPYENLDDIRHISWINSAKLGEPYVKKMHEERELLIHVTMLLDGRAVIGKKHELMTYILATLGYSSVATNNLFEASFIFGTEFKGFESTKNIEAVEILLNEFSTIEPLGLELENQKTEKRLLKGQEQKSLFFLVGDFLDEFDLSILAQKHELCVIIVRDRWEENPMLPSDVELVNPLSNSNISKSLSRKALLHYQRKLAEHDEKLYAHFHKHQIKYVKVYNKDEVFQKLEELFYS